MAISSAARKVLWGRSSNVCAFPRCDQELTVNLHDQGTEALKAAGIPLGEEAHIISGAKDGPRFDSSYPSEEVDTYENLILLCPTHHRLIDKSNGAGFTAEDLRSMKVIHEAKQRSQKSDSDRRREEIEMRTLAMVDGWSTMADLDQWESFTSRLNAPIPRLSDATIASLTEQVKWVMVRVWPENYPEVKRAFDNYGLILADTVHHIKSHMEPLEHREGYWEIYREYKYRQMTQVEYNACLKELEYNLDVLYELSYELTRAANFACFAIRKELDPLFRFEQGALPHRVGDGIFLNKLSREEYSTDELSRVRPYLGMDELRRRVDERGGASR